MLYIIVILVITSIVYKLSKTPSKSHSIIIQNTNKWLDFLSQPAIDNKWIEAYKCFYLKDKIDYDKFTFNLHAEVIISRFKSLENWKYLGKLAMDDVPNAKINPTPTYRKYLSNSLLRDIPLGFDDWFYLAYPDVLIWFKDNYENIMKIAQQNEELYANENGLKLPFFRLIINEYSRSSKLECSI